jgi:hypothetical protein
VSARERFHAVMNFQPFDRLPILEWAGWWDKTIERWHAEGLPATLKDRYDICRHFGLDLYWQDWVPARKPTSPARHGAPLVESLADYEALRPHLFPSPDELGARWPAWERAALRAEFEQLLPTAAKGGFLISCDHQTPPAVSYADYQLYVKLFREYTARAGALSRQKPNEERVLKVVL